MCFISSLIFCSSTPPPTKVSDKSYPSLCRRETTSIKRTCPFALSKRSVCYGRTRDGRCARSGGWGHLIGDGGSAYGLGRDALCAVARDIDGCSEHTVLTSMLSERKGLVDQNTIISYVYSNDKRAVSSLSPIVEEACSACDPVAMRIIEDNAKDLVSDVLAVSDRLALTRCRIVLLGGLLENDTCFRKCFVRLLGQSGPTLEVVEPLHNAAEGALLEAKVSGR